MSQNVRGHGGDLALAALANYGVRELFTLSGGHIFPLYVVFRHGEGAVPDSSMIERTAPDPDEVERAAALIAGAERPALIAGTDVYFASAWPALRAAVENLRVPVFANGLGRGCLAA